MLLKTHLVIGLFGILVYSLFFEFNAVYALVFLIATLLPDIDSPKSWIGKSKMIRPLHWFVKHRGIFHSLTIGIIIAEIFVFLLGFGTGVAFFLGYGVHLLVDSFTVAGIRPLWPLNWFIRGRMKTGSRGEQNLFVLLLVVDAVLLTVLIIG